MDVRPIRTEEDYDWALREVEPYFEAEPEPGSPEGDRFDVLVSLIEAYEAKRWPITSADPVEALRLAMAMRGLGQSDLASVLGSRSRASEVLSGRRALSLAAVHRIHRAWGMPMELLVGGETRARTRRIPSGRAA